MQQEESKTQGKTPPIIVAMSETDEFVSCEDGAAVELHATQSKRRMELDIQAINVEVDGPTVPNSSKASGAKGKPVIPRLDLPDGGKKHNLQTPSSRRDPAQIHLPTMHESDYDGDPMNVGHMATTNLSHDSESQRDAEAKFRDLLTGEANDSSQPHTKDDKEEKKHDEIILLSDEESEASPVKEIQPKIDTTKEKAPDQEPPSTGLIKMQATEAPEEESKTEGTAQGANMVLDNPHRQTAIEIFENYFAKAYSRKQNAPMTKARFLRTLARAEKRGDFDAAYVEQFSLLFDDAKKDEQGRMSSESLIDAIVTMLEKQDAQMEEEQVEESTKPQEYAPKNRLQERAQQMTQNPFASDTKEQIRDDLFSFFEKYEKTFFASKSSHENKVHVNLSELQCNFRDFENLIGAEENSETHKEHLLLSLLLSITPRGEMFIGKHGTGLMTLAEFTKIVEEAFMADTLKYQPISGAHLDESIDFNRDAKAGGLGVIEHSAASQGSPLLTDRNLRSAMQEDAQRLVERFTSSYKELNEEVTAVGQFTEMVEYLVNENQHEILGVSPKALQEVFDLLRDKLNEVKQDYEELETQKEQFKEIHLLRDYCQELENDKERLQAFEQRFLEAQDEIKAVEIKLQKSEAQTQKLTPLLQINDDLKSEIETLQIDLQQKDFKFKALQEDHRMLERQLERIENQNKIFDSDSVDGSSDEEAKSGGRVSRNVVSGASNSFEDSADRGTPNNRSRTSESAANTLMSTTGKSNDSGIESTNYRALQESLESFQQQDTSDSNRARQEVLQVAEKMLAEKTAIAKQLDLMKDKARAFKSKLATAEDKIDRLSQQASADKERHDQLKSLIKKKDFSIEEMKMALEEMQKDCKAVSLENKRLQAANQELERKIKAERAERMSMSNNSFVSGMAGGFTGRLGGGGGGNARDILSRSILENSMAGGGNTSIMDLMTGHAAPSMKEIQNRSMSLSKPREHSFVSSQKSFFSKKPKELAARQDQKAGGNTNNMLDGESFSDESEGGVIKKVDAFSDENSEASDESDCVVETDSKIKSTGFFHKLRLRDIMKSKGQKKVDVFREGESEEYNSEVDGEPSIDAGTAINYDILGVRDGQNSVHQPLLELVLKFEELPENFDDMLTYKGRTKHHQKALDDEWQERMENLAKDEEPEERPLVDPADITRDFLTSDQSFIFSDEMVIFDNSLQETYLAIVDQRVYILYKSSMNNMYVPFDLEELAAVVMSPSNPMSAAFRMKDQNKLGRSHIIFQNQNMGLMIRFIQELEAYWLSVEFSDTIAMTVDKKPVSFNFKDIATQKQKEQNQGLVNCAAQGYLYKKKAGFAAFWRDMFSEDNWQSSFYVLTNVGILVFEEENFSNPTRLIPLGKLQVAPVAQKQAGKPFAFRLTIDEEEEITVRAPDKKQFETWMTSLRDLIQQIKSKPKEFQITSKVSK